MLRRPTVIGSVPVLAMEVTDSNVVTAVFSPSTTTTLATTTTMRVAWRCVEPDFYIDRIAKIDNIIKRSKLSHDTKKYFDNVKKEKF